MTRETAVKNAVARLPPDHWKWAQGDFGFVVLGPRGENIAAVADKATAVSLVALREYAADAERLGIDRDVQDIAQLLEDAQSDLAEAQAEARRQEDRADELDAENDRLRDELEDAAAEFRGD